MGQAPGRTWPTVTDNLYWIKYEKTEMKLFRRFSFSFCLSSVFSYPTDNPLLTSSQILYYIHSGRGVAGTGKGITWSRNKKTCFSEKLRHLHNQIFKTPKVYIYLKYSLILYIVCILCCAFYNESKLVVSFQWFVLRREYIKVYNKKSYSLLLFQQATPVYGASA